MDLICLSKKDGINVPVKLIMDISVEIKINLGQFFIKKSRKISINSEQRSENV